MLSVQDTLGIPKNLAILAGLATVGALTYASYANNLSSSNVETDVEKKYIKLMTSLENTRTSNTRIQNKINRANTIHECCSQAHEIFVAHGDSKEFKEIIKKINSKVKEAISGRSPEDQNRILRETKELTDSIIKAANARGFFHNNSSKIVFIAPTVQQKDKIIPPQRLKKAR